MDSFSNTSQKIIPQNKENPMKRLIVSAPSNITFDDLTTEQKLGLEAVMANYVQPMPGTKSHDNKIIIDCVMQDNFDPVAITDLGLPFEIMGYWDWNGSDNVETIIPLSPDFIQYLPNRITYDEQGNELESFPPVLHIPHTWAGWKAITV